MKKLNYFLLALIALAFAFSVVSMAEETSLSPSQKLKENIEKYAKEKEIKDPLQASWEYHRTSPKEEWLPIWKEILLNGTLAESVTNWVDFAKVPLFFLCQVDDPTWPDDSHFLNIATDFKKLCEEPNHFTLDDFVDELPKMFRNLDVNCCYPTGDAFRSSPQKPQRIASTKHTYHIYSLGDVLKFLGLKNVIEKIVSDKLDWLKKTHYSPLHSTSYVIYDDYCLGDLSSSFFNIPVVDASKDPFTPDWKWKKLSGFANHCGMHELFAKGLKEAAEIHTDYFPLGKMYCENILENDPDAAREFLKTYYPFGKICHMPDAYPGYAELCRWLDLPIKSEIDRDCVYLIAQWQLYHSPDQFCKWGTWFWETDEENPYAIYGDIKRKVAKPMLEGLDYHTEYTIRRLGELSDIEEFTYYLRKKFKKRPTKELAFELAMITDDPEEFEKTLEILSKDERGQVLSVLNINQGQVSCLIKILRDEFPASCARKILDMIKASGIASNFDFPYYAKKFSKWCEKKGETEVVAELDKLISETKVKSPNWRYDPANYLNKQYGESDFMPGTKFGLWYYQNTPQYKWLPIWKKILESGNLSQSVSNWLIFAKNPIPNIKDSNDFIKKELNERFRNYCSENGEFTFNEFVDALVNAPVNEEVKVRDDAVRVYSSLEELRPVLDSLTFYQIVDALEYLDCTNDISRVSARAGIDFSKNKKW